MKKLNLGCGYHYSSESGWVNLDFHATGNGVVAHNLRSGIPFESGSVDLVYHSHVLEHFTKHEGDAFIGECFRILKPGGIIRIAVPDLEKIARNYLDLLKECLSNPVNDMAKLNYEWTMLELFDQMVRNVSGGEMANYLRQRELKNHRFVFQRIGEEGKKIRSEYLQEREKVIRSAITHTSGKMNHFKRLKAYLRKKVLQRFAIDEDFLRIGEFRMGGEIHFWMYDKFSLSALLQSKGFVEIIERDAFTSYLACWHQYNLDALDGTVRKPDSLFIEARKYYE